MCLHLPADVMNCTNTIVCIENKRTSIRYHGCMHIAPYEVTSCINKIMFLQILVQRILAAKNLTHAKGSCVISAILKPLPLVLMIWPGMISRILYPGR
jgi:uncharacterized sodium:solute symporter family permease YidK